MIMVEFRPPDNSLSKSTNIEKKINRARATNDKPILRRYVQCKCTRFFIFTKNLKVRMSLENEGVGYF